MRDTCIGGQEHVRRVAWRSGREEGEGIRLARSQRGHKAVVSLATGLEDAEKVTVAFLVSVGAAESGRPTLMFLTKEAVRLAIPGFARAVACDGCPPLPDLMTRYEAAGGALLVCPICFDARTLDKENLLGNARMGGTVPMWEWIGDEAATTFSY
jgi:predicted peroxiredoxin